jgi:hypothetical protein
MFLAMTPDQLRQSDRLLFECVSGSRAYGLDTPTSDWDLKGVFAMTRDEAFGLHPQEQVSSKRHDEVYYELGRFIRLLRSNNPNLIEMLGVPERFVRHRDPLMAQIRPELFLSRLCHQTFAGYARAQISKARGLNKKIVNPVEATRKSPLAFCYVTQGQHTLPLPDWLEAEAIDPAHCGLVNLPHMRNFYALYHDPSGGELGFKGIFAKANATQVAYSSVPPGHTPRGHLFFNQDGYSTYCKDYRAYWDWVAERNEARYEATLAHGQQYDTKNMMHTFRLLRMAREILAEGRIVVFRPDREELLAIRRGEFSYEELVAQAEGMMQEIEGIAARSPLPPKPDERAIERLLIDLREATLG